MYTKLPKLVCYRYSTPCMDSFKAVVVGAWSYSTVRTVLRMCIPYFVHAVYTVHEQPVLCGMYCTSSYLCDCSDAKSLKIQKIL